MNIAYQKVVKSYDFTTFFHILKKNKNFFNFGEPNGLLNSHIYVSLQKTGSNKVDNALEKTSSIELAEQIRQYQREMYRLSFVILKNETDAQDAVSETIVKAFESKDKLKDKEKIKQWLMKILVNVSKTMLKNRQRLVLIDDTEQLDSPVMDSSDELWEVVMQLEEEFRTVVVLYYYQCFSTKEISWMMKVPEGTVKSRLARAREKLKVLV